MPDHHLLNGLFSHGGREKYPPAALNWVLAVPNLIHTYIDTNFPKAYKDKKRKYIPLVSQMQQMYREYKTSITIIAVGALRAIPKTLTCDIQRLGITKEKTRTVIHRIQRAAHLGIVKVCKTALKM